MKPYQLRIGVGHHRLWVDRWGVCLDLGTHRWAWWRRGAWVPLSVRRTPEHRYGRLTHSRRPKRRAVAS